MITRFQEALSGTLIRHMGAWVLGGVYTTWNVVEHNDMTYRCTTGHVAAAATEPGVGGSWGTVWEVWGPAGNIWGNRALNIIFDGGGVVLTTGVKAMFEAPYDLQISSGKLFSLDNTSGSIEVQLWKGTYTNPPTSAGNIHTFSLSSAAKSSKAVDLELSTGDIIFFKIESVTSIKIACLSLMVGPII